MRPDRFREELKRFDKRLDFIWNGSKSCWQVMGVDRRNVNYVIYDIPLGKIDDIAPQVIKSLYETSPIKQGGAAAVNRRIDAQIEQEEAAENRHMENVIEAVSSEAHELFMRKMKLRISNVGIPETIEVRDHRRVTDAN